MGCAADDPTVERGVEGIGFEEFKLPSGYLLDMGWQAVEQIFKLVGANRPQIGHSST